MYDRYQVTEFGCQATPSFGVAGEAYVSGRTAGSNDRMFDVVDFLIRQQRNANRD